MSKCRYCAHGVPKDKVCLIYPEEPYFINGKCSAYKYKGNLGRKSK